MRKIYIFAFSFIFYVFLGATITTQTIGEYNMFFGADTPRICIDMLQYGDELVNHHRIPAHPFFLIMTQPIGVAIDGLFAYYGSVALYIESIVSAAANVFVYCIIKGMNIPKKIAILMTMIYGFSFSTILFSTIPETFIFGTFFLSATWLYVVHLKNRETQLDIKDYIVLFLLAFGCMGSTITNYVFYLVPVAYIFWTKRKTVLSFFCNCALMGVANMASFFALAKLQKFIWKFCPVFWTQFFAFSNGTTVEKQFMDFGFSWDKVVTWFKMTVVFPMLAGQMELNGELIVFDEKNSIVTLVMGLVIILTLLACVKYILGMIRKKECDLFWTAILVAYLGNLLLHFIYGYVEAFIYSPHYTFLFVLAAAKPIYYVYTESQSKTKNIFSALGIIFLLCEIFINLAGYSHTRALCMEFYNLDYSLVLAMLTMLPSVIVTMVIVMLILILRAVIYNKTSLKNTVTNVYLRVWIIYIAAIAIGCVFIFLKHRM